MPDFDEAASWDSAPGKELTTVQESLRQEQETNLLLVESIAELEAALETEGWTKLSADGGGQEFSGAGRKLITDLCRTVAVANPLIKRGLNLRIAYIWGSAERSGVQVQARDDKVNEVVQRFWDDNVNTLTGTQAQEELERALGTDGNVYLAAFTNPLTGRVRVRSTPAAEITGIVTNPDDRDEPWFYTREYTKQVIEPGYDPGNTRTRQQSVKEAYPALGYSPARKFRTINGYTVKWDAPMMHVAVNRLDGWQFGIPDVYAAVAWARAYKDFLTDWALLTKSLAKFAWRVSGDSRSRTAKAAAAIRANNPDPTLSVGANVTGAAPAGAAAAMGPGNVLEAIPKSGASIDAESGKPLAAMVASGLGVPVTLLLADPGVTGARAVAETLDKPTILEMGMRRMLWQSKIGQLLDYVVDQSAIAPKGGLAGTVTIDDWGDRVTKLTGTKDRNIDWNWPPLFDLDPIQLVGAIVQAQSTQLFTGPLAETIVRLLLQALGVEDVDETMADMFDEQGNFIDPSVTAGQVAADAFRAGKDPAQAVGSAAPAGGKPATSEPPKK
jgi:hypothetical protein